MPVLVGLLLAVIGFIWWSWGRNKAAGEVSSRMDKLFRKKPCKWETTGDAKGALVEYRCATCGVSAYSRTGTGPADCKRNLRGGL